MYGGDMDMKPALDPYADPPAVPIPAPEPVVAETNGGGPANGSHANDRAGRGRSGSRSRSRSPVRGNRSPKRGGSPPGFYRRRSPPPPPRRPAHAPMAPNPSSVLGVFGLSIRTQERQLEDEFNRYGHTEKVTIVYDARTGRSRGFGFIAMSKVEEATECIEKLNGIELDGRRIRVDYSVTDRPHAPTPGEYMGTRRDADRAREERGGGGGGGGGRGGDRYERSSRGGGYDRDRDYRRSDRERDPYGGGSHRDWRDKDRDRDWRRSPPPTRSRYSASPPPRRRRSYSRSPPRASGSSAPKREEEPERGPGRW